MHYAFAVTPLLAMKLAGVSPRKNYSLPELFTFSIHFANSSTLGLS